MRSSQFLHLMQAVSKGMPLRMKWASISNKSSRSLSFKSLFVLPMDGGAKISRDLKASPRNGALNVLTHLEMQGVLSTSVSLIAVPLTKTCEFRLHVGTCVMAEKKAATILSHVDSQSIAAMRRIVDATSAPSPGRVQHARIRPPGDPNTGNTESIQIVTSERPETICRAMLAIITMRDRRSKALQTVTKSLGPAATSTKRPPPAATLWLIGACLNANGTHMLRLWKLCMRAVLRVGTPQGSVTHHHVVALTGRRVDQSVKHAEATHLSRLRLVEISETAAAAEPTNHEVP